MFSEDRHHSLTAFYNTFPNLTFTFNRKVNYTMEPKDYLMLNSDYETFYCIGVKPLDKNLFGAIFMRNHDFKFYRQKKKIGFVKAIFNESEAKSAQGDFKDSQPSSLSTLKSEAIDLISSDFTIEVLKMAAKMILFLVLFLFAYIVIFIVWLNYKAKTKNEKKRPKISTS